MREEAFHADVFSSRPVASDRSNSTSTSPPIFEISKLTSTADSLRLHPPSVTNWNHPILVDIDRGVAQYVENLGLPAEVYAPKLVSIGLKSEAILNATRKHVSDAQKTRLESALQTEAGLSFAEAIVLMAGLR